MKNDFISILKTIEPKEQEGFKTYIHCFYGTQKVSLAVYEDIAAALPSDTALATIRKASVGDKNKLNAFSDLKGWLFEFLAVREIQNNTTEAKFLGLEALRKRGLHEVSQQKAKQLTLELKNNQQPNLWHLFWKVRLAHINYFHLPLDKILDYQTEMQQLLRSLDDFYASAKLLYSAELYSRSTIRQEAYTTTLLEPVLTLLETEATLHPITKDLYLSMLELTQNQSEKAYAQLKQFLIQKPKHDPLERQAVLIYLLNFAASRLRKGEADIIQEIFDLYQLGLNQSLFSVLGYFPTSTFSNIINTCCRLGKYEWGKTFIQKWAHLLPPNEKNEIVCFATARIHFEEKEFDKVIALLSKVTFKNFNITLNVRLLLLRAYYEQKTPDYLMADYNNALYLYVYRSKHIGTALQESVFQFVKMFRSMLSEKRKEQLLKELTTKRLTAICYDWLKMKIEERTE